MVVRVQADVTTAESTGKAVVRRRGTDRTLDGCLEHVPMALSCLRRRNDDDRAGRVVNALRADRAEQKAREAAAAARPDNKQLGILGGRDQSRRGPHLHELADELELGLERPGLVESLVEHLPRSRGEVLVDLLIGRLDGGGSDHPGIGYRLDQRNHPGVYDVERGRPQAGFGYSPLQRPDRAGRTVDADDDLRHQNASGSASRSIGQDMQRGPPRPRPSSDPAMVITSMSSWRRRVFVSTFRS